MSFAKVIRFGTAALYVTAAALAVGVIRDRYFGSHSAGQNGAGQAAGPVGEQLRPAVFARIATAGRRLGPEDAPVVIVVYSAYACGHCAEFEGTLVRLRRRYPDHLAVVMKHFVPTAVRTDIEAHEAAECAADQGKFDEFTQAYFRIGQTRVAREPWREIGDSIGIPNRTGFAACVHSGQFSKLIESDTEEGVLLGVAGTPTSFVNGTRVVGTVSFDALERFVAEQLGRSPKNGL